MTHTQTSNERRSDRRSSAVAQATFLALLTTVALAIAAVAWGTIITHSGL